MAAELTIAMVMRLVDRASQPLRRAGGAAKTYFKGVSKAASAVGKDYAKVKSAASGVGQDLARVGALGVGGLFAFKKFFVDTAVKLEGFRTQLAALEGGSAKAEQSMQWLQRFSERTPAEVESLMGAFVKLKGFGLDPLADGTLQSIVDQTSKLGYSQERLEAITTRIGKAWAKNKLDGEASIGLMEEGVPVFELLSKATGHSAAELEQAAAKGNLSRKAIRLLIDEMGKSSAGAAAASTKTWTGMVAQLGSRWTGFVDKVMQAGVFDSLKSELSGLLAKVDEMAKSGELDELAKNVAEGIKDLGRALKDMALFAKGAVDAVGGVGNAAKILGVIFAAGPIVRVLSLGFALANLGVSSVGAGVAVAKFGLSLGRAALSALPAAAPFLAVALAVGAVGLALYQLHKHWDELNMSEAWKGMKEAFGEDGFLSTVGQLFDPRTLLKDMGIMGKTSSAQPIAAPLAPLIAPSAADVRSGVAAPKGVKPPEGKVVLELLGQPARVREASAKGMELEVDAGLSMVAP